MYAQMEALEKWKALLHVTQNELQFCVLICTTLASITGIANNVFATTTAAISSALTMIPMATGLASVIGSSTIIAAILRCSQKLANPYRRIIFGMSCFYVFQSLSWLMITFKTDPVETSWLALGNQTGCQLFGFFQFVGHNGTLFYSLSLNIFYLCLVKYQVKRDNFCHRIEPFLHGVPIAWAFASGSYIVATGHLWH